MARVGLVEPADSSAAEESLGSATGTSHGRYEPQWRSRVLLSLCGCRVSSVVGANQDNARYTSCQDQTGGGPGMVVEVGGVWPWVGSYGTCTCTTANSGAQGVTPPATVYAHNNSARY
jgi:hypothetical protein